MKRRGWIWLSPWGLLALNRRSWISSCLPGALIAVEFPANSGGEEPSASRREATVLGTCRFLPDVLKPRGIEADAGPVAQQIVVEQSDREIVPLLSNGASRAVWLDERLRGRPAEVRGWLHAGLPYLEVTNVRVEEQGMLRTPGYYCEICTITVRYPQACPCCQGPLELRWEPRP